MQKLVKTNQKQMEPMFESLNSINSIFEKVATSTEEQSQVALT